MAVTKARMHMLQMRLIQATAIVISGMTLNLEALELQFSTFHLYHNLQNVYPRCRIISVFNPTFTPILEIF
jgi:hypothetical protein